MSVRKLLLSLGLLVLSACAPRLAPPGPAIIAPSLVDDAFQAADGTMLPVHHWLPEDKTTVTAAIIALHGFNDYGAFFDQPGPDFAAHGFACYAYDQRGFGQSPHRGMWPGAKALKRDLAAFVDLIRRKHPGVPVYVIGESMGGAVTMAAVTDKNPPNVDGIILAAPAVWARQTMPFYQRWALSAASHTFPWVRLSGRGLNIKPSDNIEMLRALGRDPLVIKKSRIDTLWGLTNLMDEAFEVAPRLDTPALILYGARDEIITGKPAKRMMASLPAKPHHPRRVAVYETGWHMLLRDLNAETVWRDIRAWIADPHAPLPSRADQLAVKNGWIGQQKQP